ncbi:hypothetical protein GALMADRAFT_651263 [Galerina marginata CBS 339.88]|uniref:WD40 repeat-like protein n=1 Tax=Galerina marginata (strain CBS 339.88) TaxID=685588 RepID=A0A067TK72_GALM3|nr:hypothetical protein GALMADRAFT_651263 [Galerina marginata CBS 339.88]
MSTLENLSILNTFEDDPYRNLSKDVYEQDDDSDSSDMSTSPPPHGRRSPGKEPASPTIGHVQDRLAAHLRNCFELPDPRTKTNKEIKKTRLQVRQDKASTSRITLPTPRDASRNDKLETYIVALPKSPHNKPRRVLLSKDSADAPIITVSMRGDVQFFDRNKWHRISRFSRPNDSVYRHVVDATIVGATAIIGYGNGPSQISLVRLSEGSSPLLVDLEQNRPHKVSLDSGSRTGKAAISCLAAKKSTAHITQFFTGGHDKTLRLWSVGDANLATSEKLTTLTTIPEALGFRDRSLIVGTSRKILTVDLGHLSSIPTSAQLSNSVCQIHIHSQAPNVTILEVNSLDFQVQIFDDRKKQGFDRVADCYFGARQARTSARSTRGDTDFSMFVKGYEDGTVRMWDFRNSKVSHKNVWFVLRAEV